MDRRTFLKHAASGAACLLVGCGDSRRPTAAGVTRPGVSASHRTLAQIGTYPGTPPLSDRIPRTLMQSGIADLDLDLQVISGLLPTDLHGHYFSLSSQPWGDGSHHFNGEGLITRIDLGQAPTPRLKRRILRSPSYFADRATVATSARFENRGKGQARISDALGLRNYANTAPVAIMDGRILTTSDAGRPYEIDPVSLEYVTAVGWRREWETVRLPTLGHTFPLAFSTTHASYDDRTGELFSLNMNNIELNVLGWYPLGQPFTDLLRWGGQGALERWGIVDAATGRKVVLPASGHQLQATRRHVIVMDSAFKLELPKLFFPQWTEAVRPVTTFWIIDRQDLARLGPGADVPARRVSVPRESVHFFADYDDAGLLRIVTQHNCSTDYSEWLLGGDRRLDSGMSVEADLVGMTTGPLDLNHVGVYEVEPSSGQVVRSELFADPDQTWGLNLYTWAGSPLPERLSGMFWCSLGFNAETITERLAGTYGSHPHRTVPLSQLPFGGKPGTLFRLELTPGPRLADAYTFPAGRLPFSPQHVSLPGRPPADTEGYVVCIVLSDDTSWPGSTGDEVWVFDAGNLAQGPLCRLGHPQLDLPFTFHNMWLPSIRPRGAGYEVPVEADLRGSVDGLSPWLQDMFRREVYPHF